MTSTLPPPLSAPPTVATLQGLLDGLQQPMRRGVPSPPPCQVFEQATDPAPRRLPAPATPPTPPVSLTWSAARVHHHPRRTAALAAVAAAAGTVTAVVVAAELALP